MKNKQGAWLGAPSSISRIIISCAFVAAFVATSCVVEAGGWSRDMIPMGTMSADQYKFRAFELVSLSGEDDSVRGFCVFVNSKPALSAIEGIEAPDGEFYPTVTLAVANEKTGVWQTISAPVNTGKNSILTVDALRPSKTLVVSLDVLRPMIGKFKYGKIALKSGEATVFELDKLLPPS